MPYGTCSQYPMIVKHVVYMVHLNIPSYNATCTCAIECYIHQISMAYTPTFERYQDIVFAMV